MITSALAFALAACAPDRDPAPAGPKLTSAPANRPPAIAPANPPAEARAIPAQPLIGEAIARAEWAKAANHATCAPLALAGDGGAAGTPRSADFSDGWAVAFDLPDQRSAYGFAGTGLLPEDRDDFTVQVARLAEQWPLMRRWDAGDNLPAGSAAGYGLSGAEPFQPPIRNPPAASRSLICASPASRAAIMSGAVSAARISKRCSASSAC